MGKIACFFKGHDFKLLGHTEGEWKGEDTTVTLHHMCKSCMYIKTEDFRMGWLEKLGYEAWFWKPLETKDIEKYKETLHA
jgi:hypothetical protein